MVSIHEAELALSGQAVSSLFASLYQGRAAEEKARYRDALRRFSALYGDAVPVSIFSAPGRTEIAGNHTDHNCGLVLAAAIDADVVAVVSARDDGRIALQSEGMPSALVDLSDLSVQAGEQHTSAALIRGVAKGLSARGFTVGGFNAYVCTTIPTGSGLSSSAAFEVLICKIISVLYNKDTVPPVLQAQIGQFAENVYFGKPCGLMDQLASASGACVSIDFLDAANPIVEGATLDLDRQGFSLCLTAAGGGHENLTPLYAAIGEEMRDVAALCGVSHLGFLTEADFYKKLPVLRGQVSDRALLRAVHFFSDCSRVKEALAALRGGDFAAFLSAVRASGVSSALYLQNCAVYDCPAEQPLLLALALSEKLLLSRGAWRIHGGGFAGTIQAFVPKDLLPLYQSEMDKLFGEGACRAYSVRPFGAVQVL